MTGKSWGRDQSSFLWWRARLTETPYGMASEATGSLFPGLAWARPASAGSELKVKLDMRFVQYVSPLEKLKAISLTNSFSVNILPLIERCTSFYPSKCWQEGKHYFTLAIPIDCILLQTSAVCFHLLILYLFI